MKTTRRFRPAALDRYLQELGSRPPLRQAEEHRLALRMRRLRERLVALLEGPPRPRCARLLPGGSARTVPLERLEVLVARLDDEARARSSKALQARAARARTALQRLQAVRTLFVTRNLRLAIHFAKRVGRKGTIEDLIQAGNIGLLEATDRFDPSRGTRFSTYAVMYITRAVYRSLPRLNAAVHVPEYQRRLRNRLKDSRRGLLQELGRTPTLAETAARASLREDKARMVLSSVPRILDLDAPRHGLEQASLAETLEDRAGRDLQEVLVVGDLLEHLRRMLPTLEPRQRTVLSLRYGLGGDESGRTLDECGRLLGLSRERIRQIEEEALAALRMRMRRLGAGRVPAVGPARRADRGSQPRT